MHDDDVVCSEICGCFAWNNGGDVLVQRKCRVVCKCEDGRMWMVKVMLFLLLFVLCLMLFVMLFELVLIVKTVVKCWRFLEILVGWSCGVK